MRNLKDFEDTEGFINPDDDNDDWRYYVDSFSLENNQGKKVQIMVVVPGDAIKAKYGYIVEVTADGQQYGVKRIYVNV